MGMQEKVVSHVSRLSGRKETALPKIGGSHSNPWARLGKDDRTALLVPRKEALAWLGDRRVELERRRKTRRIENGIVYLSVVVIVAFIVTQII